MKKWIALTLCLLTLLALCACDSAESGAGGKADDYVFKKGDVTIAVDADLAPVIEALGEPINYVEAPSCAHTGTSKYYTYAGIDIESYPDGMKDRIYIVALIDDSVATAEGIRIGDSRDDLMEVYGEPTSSSEKILLYEAKGMYLKFIMNAGGTRISQIQYMHPDAID